MTLPYLSQFSNPVKAAARLTAAMKQAVSAIDEKTELGKALVRAEADGVVSPQEIHQLQAEVTKSSSYNRTLRKAGFVWGSLFSLAEQFNRRTTFIAAYEQAKADGKANPYEFATKAVEETQGIYNKANKPNWARGAVGGVVFTFKQYSISYLEFLTRLPRREQVFALALLMLAAGAEGLPFADDLDDLLDTLGQKLGYNWNSKREKREFLTETIGMSPDFANILLRGGSAIPGIPLDVSSRMGMANLIPGTGLLLEHKKDKSQDVLEFIGPAGSLAQQAVAGMGKTLEGDIVGAGKELLPVALQNALKSADMMQTGMYRDRGGRNVTETSDMEAIFKGAGFQPRSVADIQQRTRIVSQDNELAKAKESKFAQRWAEARFEGDQEAEAEVRADIQRWNERNPEAPIRIKLVDVLKRVRNMKTDKNQRTIKQATPEMRAYTREALN